MRATLSFVALVALSGCSLILDGDGLYADPRAPSQPTIALTPGTPDTADDLVVSITSPAVNPSGGEVRYEYVWTINEALVPTVTTERLPAASTSRGQTVTVLVTPVGVDTERRGRPATATVTIVNALPIVQSAGLDAYQPTQTARVRVQLDAITDADEDVTSPRFQWFLDGNALAGQTGDELDLSGTTATAGSVVRVDVSAFDGTEIGPTLSVGPVTVISSGPRWEPLSPAFTAVSRGAFLADPSRPRWVFVSRNDVWELVKTPTGQRVAWLGPNAGPSNLAYAESVIDVPNQRAIVFTNGNPDTDTRGEVWALSFNPGAQPWTKLNPGGTKPSARRDTHVVYDATHRRVVLYGGVGPADAVLGDIFTLDLTTPGAETWTKLSLVDAAPLAGVTLLDDPIRNRVLVFGGHPEAGGVPDYDDMYVPPPGRIAALSRDATGAFNAFTILPQTLPRQAMRMGAVHVPTTDEIVIAYGVYAISDYPFHTAIYRLNGTSLAATEVAVPPAMHSPSDLPVLGYDAARDLVTIWDGFTYTVDSRPIRRLKLNLGAATLEHDFGYGRELVPGTYRMSLGVSGSDFLLIPIQSPRIGTFGDYWRFDSTTKSMTRESIAVDPSSGLAPSSFSGLDFETTLRSGLPAIMRYESLEAWSVRDEGSGLHWTSHDVAVPQSARYYATIWDDPCGAELDVYNEAVFYALDCNVSGHACTWSSTGTVVSALGATRTEVAQGTAGYITFLFGGRRGFTNLNDVFRRSRGLGGVCSAGFAAVSPLGVGPASLAHAMTAWDDTNARFFITGVSSSVWALQFGVGGDPNSGTPTWREIDSSDVTGPWYAPLNSDRTIAYHGKLIVSLSSGALYMLHPD